MNKIDQWINTKGKRLMELKVKGHGIFEAKKHLSEAEFIEFLLLSGQLDAMFWFTMPKKNQSEYYKDIMNKLSEHEELFHFLISETGKTQVPKGVA